MENKYIYIISNISTNNKYFRWWKSIITKSLCRASTRKQAKMFFDYVEGHHILPISFNLGGEKDKSNICFLSAKEHVLIHQLMCKFIHPDYVKKCMRAFHSMCYQRNGGKNKRFATKTQRVLAREYANICNTGKRYVKNVPDWFKHVTSDFDVFATLLKKHVDDGLSDPKIGKIYGVSAAAVHSWRKKLNIENRRWQLRDKNWLHEQYVVNKLSCSKIADIIGCTEAAVNQYMLKYGIEFRSASERQKLASITRNKTNHQQAQS